MPPVMRPVSPSPRRSVVLAGGEDHDALAIDDGQHGDLAALQALLDHDPGTGVAELAGAAIIR